MKKIEKVFICLGIFLALLLCAGSVLTVSIEQDYHKTENEQLENKIEQLQKENASLHDEVWVLNQELMKGCME